MRATATAKKTLETIPKSMSVDDRKVEKKYLGHGRDAAA